MHSARRHPEATAHPPSRRKTSNVDPGFVVCAFPKAESLRLPSRDVIRSDRHASHHSDQSGYSIGTVPKSRAIQLVYIRIRSIQGYRRNKPHTDRTSRRVLTYLHCTNPCPDTKHPSEEISQRACTRLARSSNGLWFCQQLVWKRQIPSVPEAFRL